MRVWSRMLSITLFKKVLLKSANALSKVFYTKSETELREAASKVVVPTNTKNSNKWPMRNFNSIYYYSKLKSDDRIASRPPQW